MKSSVAVTVLRIPESTLRKLAREYAEYLSPSADASQAGRHRDYTDHDVRVIKLISDMKAAKQSADNIAITLNSLRASGWERLPTLDEGASAIIPAPGALLAANTERAVMQKEIDMLRERVAELKESQADRDEVLKRLHRAEQLLELYESGRLKPPGG